MMKTAALRRKTDPSANADDFVRALDTWMQAKGSRNITSLMTPLWKIVAAKASSPSVEQLADFNDLFELVYAAAKTGRVSPELLEIAIQKQDTDDKVNFTEKSTHQVAEKCAATSVKGGKNYCALVNNPPVKANKLAGMGGKDKEMLLRVLAQIPEKGPDEPVNQLSSQAASAGNSSFGKSKSPVGVRVWAPFFPSEDSPFRESKAGEWADITGAGADFLAAIDSFDPGTIADLLDDASSQE